MLNANPDKLLSKAKFGLLTHGSVFLSTVAFNLRYEWSSAIPTACVDGITITINPDFFTQATEGQRVFVLAHESWHVALNHILRRKEKDPSLYNKAGDYVINQLLKDDGYEMWDWVLQDDQYRDMSTNQVYDLLSKQPPPPNSKNMMEGDIKESPLSDKEAEAAVKTILVKAITQSKISGEKPGKIPGEIERELDKLINPILPWEMLLDRFLTNMVKDDFTWRRPNKRFAPEFYLPSQYSEALGHITIAIDTSGSISKADLTAILSEITYIKQRFNPARLTILDCDKRIHNIYDVSEADEIQDLKFTGGGGTSFDPVIDFCNENETIALLYFTDLYAKQIVTQPAYPILWLCYSNHSPAVVGETVYYKAKEEK